MEWGPLILTLKLAVITTVILFVVSLPIAYWLAYSRFRLKAVFEALVTLPLVLPPTVLGFYLLIVLSPQSGVGKFLNETFGLQFVFSFEGLVLASLIYSLPFMVHPIRAGFMNLPKTYKEAAYTLGKSRWTTLWRVLLPNMRPALLTGVVLSFAHTIGEFGVVLMIGGSLPGETRVASIAIYEEMALPDYGHADTYSLIMILTAFVVLTAVYALNRNSQSRFL